MAKVMVTVVSDDEKFDIAIVFVYRSWTLRRFDDIKLLFFGPSQRRLAKLDGDLVKIVNELAATPALPPPSTTTSYMPRDFPALKNL